MIDNGELGDIPASRAFVLGYELASIDQMLKSGGTCEGQPVHSENKERIESGLKTYNRVGRLQWCSEDQSESWMWLDVEPLSEVTR